MIWRNIHNWWFLGNIECGIRNHHSQANVCHDWYKEVDGAPVDYHEQNGHIRVQIGDSHTAPRSIHKVVHVARLSHNWMQILLGLVLRQVLKWHHYCENGHGWQNQAEGTLVTNCNGVSYYFIHFIFKNYNPVIIFKSSNVIVLYKLFIGIFLFS